MAKNEKAAAGTDFALDVSEEELAGANPNNFGGEFRRVHFGDYRFKIADIELATKEGQKPHQMLVVTSSVVHSYDGGKCDDYVGDSITSRYAGSAQSPKMMQDSRARLFAALKIGAGRLNKSQLIGREFDASVVWNLAKPYVDPDTGEKKQIVFANVTGERPVGAPRPASLNPAQMSAKAARYIADTYGDDDDGDSADDETPQPWEKAGSAAQPETQEDTSQATGFKSEEEINASPEAASYHTYRAHVKLNTEHGPAAREALVGLGVDPDGPIEVKHLPADLAAKLAPVKPALPSLPAIGANGAAPAAAGAKKGTRAQKSA